MVIETPTLVRSRPSLRWPSAEHATGATQFPVVQGLRGVAAFLVCFHHLGEHKEIFPFLRWFITNGGVLGVEIFFVLSGFIVPYSMWRARYGIRDFPRFALKRVARIDPPYFVTIALILVLNYASSRSPLFSGSRLSIDKVDVFSHFGYLTAFFHKEWLSPVFWTLAIEFQYYLLLAILFPLVFAEKRLLRLSAMVCLVAVAAYSTSGDFVGVELALFLAGIILCQFKTGRLVGFERLLYPAMVLAVLIFKLGWLATSAALFTCLTIGLLKSCPVALLFLGDISYSFYLLHWPIGTRWMNLGSRFAHGQVQFDLLFVSGFAVSIAAAWLMYRWVEVPAKNLAKLIRYESAKPVPAPDFAMRQS